MLLSIGMIVKNEEKYLRRCLEAITPLLQNVSGELIIADTGSTDDTVNIAREFTDNVFHFDWCDDFAAARNSTLEKAQGDWYLYIDADEIVEDCTGIIDFFNSGEYMKYNHATLKIKSFNDEDQKQLVITPIIRLVEKTKNLNFVNPIHELLHPLTEPFKDLDVLINHYGYVIKNNEERIKKKIDRNLRLMFKEEEKQPHDIFNIHNICQAFLLINNLPKALEYCEKGLKYSKEQENLMLFVFYVKKAQTYYLMRDFHKTLITIDEYFRKKSYALTSDIEMYVYRAQCYVVFNGYNEAIESYLKYIKLFYAYKDGRLKTPDLYISAINYIDNDSYISFTLHLIELYIKTEDFGRAYEYSKSLDIPSFQNEDLILRKLKQDVEIMKGRMDFSDLPVLLSRLNDTNQIEFQTMIEKAFEDGEYSFIIAEAFGKAAAEETAYVKLMKLRYRHLTGDMTARDVEAVLNEIEDFTAAYGDLAYFVFYCGASVELLSSKISAFDFASLPYLNSPCARQWPEYSEKLESDGLDDNRADRHLWIALLHERALLSGGAAAEAKAELFVKYGRHYMKYLQNVLREESLTEDSLYMLPGPLRLGLACGLAVEYRDNGRKTEYVRCLRQILKLEPELNGLIKTLITAPDNTEEKPPAQKEFDEYAATIKNNILALCVKNETKKALDIIAAYERLCPGDEEITALKKRIKTSSNTTS